MRILLHSPKDMVAGAAAFAAVVAIISNALFMQAGRHPSPMFGSSVALPMAAVTPPSPLPRPRPIEAKPAEAKPADPLPGPIKVTVTSPATPAPATANVMRPPAPIPPAAHSDPLGDMITTSRRIAALQRTLTEYGYGQLKPTGTVGSDTQAAIQKFERDRKLPVTGQMSDRLVRELTAMTGRPID